MFLYNNRRIPGMDAALLWSIGSASRRHDRPFQASFSVCFARAIQACVNTEIWCRQSGDEVARFLRRSLLRSNWSLTCLETQKKRFGPVVPSAGECVCATDCVNVCAGAHVYHVIRHVCVTALWLILNVVTMVPSVIPLFRGISCHVSFSITSCVRRTCAMQLTDAAG